MSEPPPATIPSAPIPFTPAIRNFAIVAFVIGVGGSIFLAFLASRAGL